ncbi:MAG: C25 family cysteine peptidase [Candidatus Delongbacteria bacterium]|jgi:hypothetical protein|nr:C25 family cysteine peptidase [Candidatus Delongbacteria bacterium]
MKRLGLITIILLMSYLVSAQETKSINMTYKQKFDIVKADNLYKGQQIQTISFTGKDIVSYSEKTGEPNIPWIVVNVSVPNGAVFKDVEIIKNNSILHENVLIEAVQEIVPVSYSGQVNYVEPNYISVDQNIYPQNNVKYAGTSKLSTYTIFNFLVAPFEYDVKAKKLYEIQDIALEITYDLEKDISSVKKWDDGDFYEVVKNIVVNSDEVPAPVKRVGSKEDVKHLIITNLSMKSTFQALSDHRIENGLTSEVITLSTIQSNYFGSTTQLKIKNCIKDYYENKGLKWVVIGGDDLIVPDQNVYGAVNGTDCEDYTIPADLFYTCFDGEFNWNANDDDKVGNVDDNVDMAPEVYIGRIPVRSAYQAAAYINKLIDYEENPPVDIADKFLMTGCELWGSVGSVSDGEAKSEDMWNKYISDYWQGTKYRFYDSNTDFTGGASYDLTASNLQEQINNGYGFVHMATHGSQSIWGAEGGYYSSNGALAQTNTKMGIIATIACITNAFDCDATATYSNCDGGPYMQDPSLGEGFIRNPDGGAVGFLGSSRYGWGSGATASHGTSFQYNDQFFYKLFTGEGQNSETGNRFGAVAAIAKLEYLGSSATNGAYRWIMYTLNVTGDPALKIITSNEMLSCKITSPENNSSYESGSIINIAAKVIDFQGKSISKVSFYLNDELLNEATTIPYSFNWDTSGLNSNIYRIKSVVTDNEGNSEEDEVSISLTSFVTIDNFETGDFTKNQWVYSGNSDWTIDDTDAYEGQYSSRSGDINDSQSSRMTLTVDFVTEGAVSFYSKVFSEGNYDYLKFYVDDTEMGRWSGYVDWDEIHFNIPSGTHDLTWEYNKDSGTSVGTDCAWIDNILLSGVTSGIETEYSTLPIENELYQNYPNPFNPVTEINFYLSNNEQVKLSVFNASGQLVKSLVDKSLNIGMYSISFDASNLNSGIYYYKLMTSSQTLAKKMLLIK